MDDIVHRIALRLKLYKISGGVVHHVALLKRIMDQRGSPTQMVRGYCVISETNEACEHYWVRTEEGLDLDVGFEVARLKNPELMALRPVLLESLPPGLTRSDQGETMILEENQRLYDLHQADPKEFWREAPRDVATFHVK